MDEDQNRPVDAPKQRGIMKDVVTAESLLQIAIALPMACVLGWLGGSALDKHFHTEWMGIVGILLGATAGFVQIIRTAMKYLGKTQ